MLLLPPKGELKLEVCVAHREKIISLDQID